MTEQDIRNIVEFVRSRQPRFDSSKTEGGLKVYLDNFYYCELYNRRSQLLAGSRDYEKAMDEIYIKEALSYFNTDD